MYIGFEDGNSYTVYISFGHISELESFTDIVVELIKSDIGARRMFNRGTECWKDM